MMMNKMKNPFIYIILFLVSISIGFSQELKQEIKKINSEINNYNLKIEKLKSDKEILQLYYIQNQIKEFALPKLEDGEELIEHKALMLVYSEKHEQAKWVAHIISPEIINGGVGRTNDFREDTMIKTGSSVEADYFVKKDVKGKTVYNGFGYDRGHLAPSADFKWSKIALSESYLYSNMSPQLGDFNRGGWAELEGMLRSYVYENKVPLFIITGPVLTDDLKPIPESINKVSIPKHFYKIAYDKQNNKAIAFIMPNKKIYNPIEYFATSIDSIEVITGIDFFANIDSDIEKNIESQTDYKPFLPKEAKNDVAPLKVLPKKCINSIQAAIYIGDKTKVTVCGTVVSTHKSKKGNIYLNLDKSYPNQIFSITIWKSDVVNFSYKPEFELKGKKICVKGKVVDYKGMPTMYIDRESSVEILE